MEKKLSCGFIIQDNNTFKFLGCVPTGSKDGLCDIPKGGQDEGETHFQCAIRELNEETGLTIEDLSNIIELGKFEYLRNKDLYLYYAQANIDLDKLHCDSTFEQYGRMVPEMKGFKLGHLDIFRKSMKATIETALKYFVQ